MKIFRGKFGKRVKATEQATSSNFSFLGARHPELERIAARSERYFSDDPVVSLIIARQCSEILAQLVAAASRGRSSALCRRRRQSLLVGLGSRSRDSGPVGGRRKISERRVAGGLMEP
jgi:hypothetical protein